LQSGAIKCLIRFQNNFILASKEHNLIVSIICGQLQRSDFNIIYLDGNYTDFSMEGKTIPPKIIKHRPDIIAENNEGSFCIGEAKTQSDLFSERTKTQFIDFLSFVCINKKNRFIIGIPKGSILILNKLLSNLEIINHPQICIIQVPNFLLKSENEEEI